MDAAHDHSSHLLVTPTRQNRIKRRKKNEIRYRLRTDRARRQRPRKRTTECKNRAWGKYTAVRFCPYLRRTYTYISYYSDKTQNKTKPNKKHPKRSVPMAINKRSHSSDRSEAQQTRKADKRSNNSRDRNWSIVIKPKEPRERNEVNTKRFRCRRRRCCCTRAHRCTADTGRRFKSKPQITANSNEKLNVRMEEKREAHQIGVSARYAADCRRDDQIRSSVWILEWKWWKRVDKNRNSAIKRKQEKKWIARPIETTFRAWLHSTSSESIMHTNEHNEDGASKQHKSNGAMHSMEGKMQKNGGPEAASTIVCLFRFLCRLPIWNVFQFCLSMDGAFCLNRVAHTCIVRSSLDIRRRK